MRVMPLGRPSVVIALVAAARTGQRSGELLRAEGASGSRGHVRQVPRARQGQRRPATRLARGDAQGGRERPGGRARRHRTKSLLIQAVEHVDESLEMPPGKLLPEGVREDLAAWVAGGGEVAEVRHGEPGDRGA